MQYKLFLDDLRKHPSCEWILAKSSKEAIECIIQNGLPEHMSLDHDLGGDDTTMEFLKQLYELYPNGPIPTYNVHSANPVGRDNIIGYLESWKRSLTL